MVIGGLLMSLLRNSDRVGVACFAQLVNVMAPIRTEPGIAAWRQPSYFPFTLTARHARGDVLRVETTSSTKVASTSRGDLEPVDIIATHDPEDGSIALFAINRSPGAEVSLEVAVAGGLRVHEHTVIGGHDWEATNTAEDPDRVGPESSTQHELDGEHRRVLLPPASWTMVRLAR